MKKSLLLGGSIIFFANSLFSQTTFEFNAISDVEFSLAGEDSHFYYNEIDKDHTKARIGLAQLSLQGKVNFSTQWAVNTRLLVERNKGKNFNKFVLPQLNTDLSQAKDFEIWKKMRMSPNL